MKTFGVQDYFIVFDISLFVTGYARAAIYDLQRSILQYIDKEIYFFCKRHNKKRSLISSVSIIIRKMLFN